MIGHTDIGAAAAPRRIGDLRRRQPADATLTNLLRVLSAKLELCAALPVYEWEAGREGFAECATAIHDLADAERQSCSETIELLRNYLEQSASDERARA